jgi:hypothetical protein
VEYAQNENKKDLFINVTMVFACVGLHGTLNRDLVGSPKVFRRPSGVPRGAEWRDRRIIKAYVLQSIKSNAL